MADYEARGVDKYRLKDPTWLSFFDDFKSATVYLKRILHFLYWREGRNGGTLFGEDSVCTDVVAVCFGSCI